MSSRALSGFLFKAAAVSVFLSLLALSPNAATYAPEGLTRSTLSDWQDTAVTSSTTSVPQFNSTTQSSQSVTDINPTCSVTNNGHKKDTVTVKVDNGAATLADPGLQLVVRVSIATTECLVAGIWDDRLAAASYDANVKIVYKPDGGSYLAWLERDFNISDVTSSAGDYVVKVAVPNDANISDYNVIVFVKNPESADPNFYISKNIPKSSLDFTNASVKKGSTQYLPSLGSAASQTQNVFSGVRITYNANSATNGGSQPNHWQGAYSEKALTNPDFSGNSTTGWTFNSGASVTGNAAQLPSSNCSSNFNMTTTNRDDTGVTASTEYEVQFTATTTQAVGSSNITVSFTGGTKSQTVAITGASAATYRASVKSGASVTGTNGELKFANADAITCATQTVDNIVIRPLDHNMTVAGSVSVPDVNFQLKMPDSNRFGPVVTADPNTSGFATADLNLPIKAVPGTWKVDVNYVTGTNSPDARNEQLGTFTVRPLIEKMKMKAKVNSVWGDANSTDIGNDMNLVMYIYNDLNDVSPSEVSCSVAWGAFNASPATGVSSPVQNVDLANKTCSIKFTSSSITAGTKKFKGTVTVNSVSGATEDGNSTQHAFFDMLDPDAVHQPEGVAFNSTNTTTVGSGASDSAGSSGTTAYNSDQVGSTDQWSDPDDDAGTAETLGQNLETFKLTTINSAADPAFSHTVTLDVDSTTAAVTPEDYVGGVCLDYTASTTISVTSAPGTNVSTQWVESSCQTFTLTIATAATSATDVTKTFSLDKNGDYNYYRVRAGVRDVDNVDDLNVFRRFKQTTLGWKQTPQVPNNTGGSKTFNPSIQAKNGGLLAPDANRSNIHFFGEARYLYGADYDDYSISGVENDVNIYLRDQNQAGSIRANVLKTPASTGLFTFDYNLPFKAKPGAWRLDANYNHQADRNFGTSNFFVKPVIYSVKTYKHVGDSNVLAYLFDINQHVIVDVNLFNDMNDLTASNVSCTLTITDAAGSVGMTYIPSLGICRKDTNAPTISGYKPITVTVTVSGPNTVTSVSTNTGDTLSTSKALIDVGFGPDLNTSDNAISFSNGTPALSESITISVGVTNTDASYDANDVNVSFYKNSISAANRIGDQIIQIGESSVATASVNWVVDTEGTVPVHVQVDPNNVSGDDVTTDNTAVKNLTVSGSGCSPPASSTWTITNANIDCNNKTFDINGDIIVGTGGNLEFRDANVRMAYNEFGNNKSSFILNARSDGVLDLNNIVLSGVGAAIDLNIDYNETSTGSIISVNISSGTNLRTRKLFARNTASLFLSGTDVNEAFMANNADFNCYNDSSPCTFRGRFTVIGPDANAKLRGFMQFNGMTAEDFNVSGDSNLKRYYPIRALTPLEAVVSGADVNVRREDTNTVLAYFNTSTTSDGLALAGADFNNDVNRTYTIIVRKQGQAFFLPLSLTTPSVFFQSSDASSSTLTGVALLRNVVDPILFTLQSDASRPIANAGDDQTVPTGGNDANVSLNPSRSYDPDNDTGATRGICMYEWDFNLSDNSGDFNPDWNACSTAAYGCALGGCNAPLDGTGIITQLFARGEHTPRLRVTDANSLTDTASVRVHVTPPGADTGIILPAIGFDAMTAVQVVLLFLAVASYLFFKNLKRVKPPRKPKPRPKPSRTRKSGPRRGKKRL